MRPLITPFDTPPEGVAVFEQAVERFDNITAFTTVKRKAYFDSQKPNDGMCWFLPFDFVPLRCLCS